VKWPQRAARFRRVGASRAPFHSTPDYRGTSLIRNSAPLGPYNRTIPRALWRSYGGGGFL